MPGRKDVFDQAMSRGHSAAWDQQWERAIAFYRAALTEIPDEAAALSALGFALLQADHPEEALAAYQRAATLTPGDPVAPEKCGEIFERLGRVNEAAQTYLAVAEMHVAKRDVVKAIENWGRVVRLTPDNMNAHQRLALALERSNRNPQSALEYVEVARLFQRARDLEKAAQAIQRALHLDPQSSDARQAADKLKRNQAIPALRHAAGPVPHTTGMLTPTQLAETMSADTASAQAVASPIDVAKETALAALAEMLFEEDTDTSKVTPSSVSAFTRGSGTLRDTASQRAQAIMYLGQALNNQSAGHLETAANNYASVLENGLDHPLVHFMLGALLLELRRPPDSIPYFQAAIAREDVALGVLYGLGEAHRQTGQTREACGYMLDALKQLDLSLVTAGQQDALAESYESMAESFSRATDEDLAKVLPGLARFLSGRGWQERAQQARKQLDAASEDGQVASLADMLATPGSDRVVESMRHIEDYMRRQLYATAMEEAFYALQFSPTYLPVHVRMAEILVADHKPDAAALKYKVVAETYRIRGEAGRAARLMQQVLKLNPMDMQARTRLIELFTDQGRLDDALTQYMDLADTYYQLADLDAAREKFNDALQLAQRSNARQWMAKVLHRIGDIDIQRLAWRDALKAYEQIKTLVPNDDKARIALIDLYFRLANQKQAIVELDLYLKQLISQRALANATKMLEELLNNYPDDQNIVARLARLYQDQGRKADAIAHYDHLGDLQLQAGQNDQARETIRTILSLGPDDRTPYEQLLAQL